MVPAVAVARVVPMADPDPAPLVERVEAPAPVDVPDVIPASGRLTETVL